MKKEIKILLASPRGFCAGVDRAIEIVKKTLVKFGSPVYVRHEIVHNTQVVENLKKLGAIFVEELDEIKDRSRPVIFSAHGVPKSVPKEASTNKMFYVDATCPLVTKVHREAERHNKNGDFAHGFLKDFNLSSGAVASSVGHDAHNIIVAGLNAEDMQFAVNRINETP